MIVGIDEVGRGPWAGPLVFGAVVLGGVQIAGLTDSKKLTKKKREALDVEVREKALAFGLGWVSAEELDEVGMSKACELGCRRALEEINTPYSEIVIDGTVNFLKETGKGPYVTTMKQADLLVPSVSAASIVAKVARDVFMAKQDELFPGYGFGAHVGYGTVKHRAALETYGVTPLHRKSFKPIAELLGVSPGVVRQDDPFMAETAKAVGNRAEEVAAACLTRRGYEVVDRNWRKSQCEIDIVAQKDNRLYFVEVKYRKNNQQGGGLVAITPKKLRQMTFAARVYLHWHGADDADWRLAVMTLQDDPMKLVDWFVLD